MHCTLLNHVTPSYKAWSTPRPQCHRAHTLLFRGIPADPGYWLNDFGIWSGHVADLHNEKLGTGRGRTCESRVVIFDQASDFPNEGHGSKQGKSARSFVYTV
jgi:hypothetical protein